MAAASISQQSFNAGELSPLVFARADVAKYKNGMARSKNGYGLVQGGWTRRSGTHYAAPTKANGVARLARFEFSTTQAYQIEFGNLYARFYMNNGPILESAVTISGATAANPVVITATSHGFSNGDDVEIAGVVGMTQLNGRRFTVANKTTHTFELYDTDTVTSVNGLAYTAYASAGTAARVYTVTTTYAAADVPYLKLTQSADTIYITHPSYPPRKLTRTAHASWTITTITFLDGPYLPTNTTTTTITPSGTTGAGITLTASAAVFTPVSDVGRLVRIKHSTTWGYAVITAVASTTSATATVSSAFGATTGSADWRLGVWSIGTGYPGAVCFYEDRLAFGGSTSYPQRIDLSKSSDYENMAPTDAAGVVAADAAIAITLNASDVNVIRWLQDDEKGLLVGTVGGEWIVRPATTSEAMSSTNIAAKRSTTYGSANAAPLRAGKATLYLQRAGRKLRELAYVYQDDGFRAPDMTVLSEHITYGGVKQIDYQQETQSIVWATRNDGILLSFIYERDQEVLGWHWHELGGFSDSAQEQPAEVEWVSCNPAPDGTRDEAWVIVKRYINGATRRYVEYIGTAWERGDAQSDAFYVGSCLTLNNTVAQTLTPGAGATVADTANVVFTAGGSVFVAGDVNRYIHYDYTDANGDTQRASAIITEYTSGTAVKATILNAWPSLTLIASAGWRMSVTTVSGLWHLEGQSVSIFADGATLPATTVANGAVTLAYAASKVAVGLGFNSDGQLMRPEPGAPDGSSQGKLRRISGVNFRLHDTGSIKIGRDFDNLTRQTFRTSSDPAGVAPPLFSGDKFWEWEGDYDRDGYVCWRIDQPEPCTVLAAMPRIGVS